MSPHDPASIKARAGGTTRDFLAVLFRRRWIILAVFAVTTVTVTAINLSQPLFYESTGKVLVKRGTRDNLLQPGLRTLTWEEELASEVETVKSDTLFKRTQEIADRTRADAGRPRVRVEPKRLEASVLGESNVIAMSYRDRDPQVALDVTAALIAAYMDYRRNAFSLQYPREFFEGEMARVSRELDQWTNRRRDFMSATGTVDLGSESREGIGYVIEERLRLSSIDQDIAEKRAGLEQMKRALAEPGGRADVPFLANSSHGNDQVITELKRKLVEAQTRRQELEQIYTPQSRELQQAQAEVDHFQALLASEVQNRVRLSANELAALGARRDEIARTLGDAESRIHALPAREARLGEMDTRISGLKQNYADLMENAEKAKISKATTPDWTVALLTPAGRPYPKNTRDYVRLALAPIFSLIVGLGLAFFVDGMDATIKNPREAEEALDIPVLASLTDQKERRA